MTFLFWLISRLPLRWLQAAGGALGLFAAWMPGRYRDRLRANFLHAFPDATPAMIAEAARSAGRMIFEMPYFWSRPIIKADLYDFNETVWPAIERLLERGQGLIVLTPHFGCFEVLPQSYAVRGPVTALFKPPNQPWLRQWIEKIRTRPNMAMAPANPRGVRMLVKALKRGEAIGILPDQVPTGGEGAWAPFFGRPAYTMTLVQRLQQWSGAPLAIVAAVRLPQGAGYQAHIRVIDGMLPDDPAEAAAVINRTVEELIALAPAQYLWGYNRYKHPAGAELPPTYDAPAGMPAAQTTENR
ncbi:lysophospholipid acyltransferase family protein [Paracidovorax citrulli]